MMPKKEITIPQNKLIQRQWNRSNTETLKCVTAQKN